MRRLILLAVAALALTGAAIAVAHDGGSKSVKQVSATFTATTGGDVRTDTCTGADGTYATTRGRWTGAAVSTEPTLNGNATVDANATVNTTTGYGIVSGRLRIDSSTGHTVAEFDAVYKNGHIAGLAEGRGDEHWTKLVANLAADWSATGGFTNGQLGGTTGGDAVLVSSGGCKQTPTPKPETVEAHGVFTLGTGTITVAGVTCSVPSTLSAAVAALHAGDRVEIKCTASGGTNTLVKVEGDHHSDHH